MLQGCQPLMKGERASSRRSKVTVKQLEEIAETPVLQLDGLDAPLMIESIELLQKGREYFVHVRSKDGAEGVALTNSRAAYLYPILNRLVIPYFIGKDARDLESHLFGVYRHQSNYKLQGIALWCPLASVEFALLDMMGRVTGKSIGELLGGVIRREVPFYVASGRRDSTPEEEATYLLKLVEETASSDVFSVLKREDEKYVTERAYNNPMFVEDIVREIALKLDYDPNITWFAVETENFESIHNHNAYAYIERTKIGHVG